MRRTRSRNLDWTLTEYGHRMYIQARKEAQQRADATGFDHGIERNDLFKSFHVFMLPRRENRMGHELRCEVVSCTSFEKMQPGHGVKV